MYKIISLNVRRLNGSRKRRQVFRWLHQKNWIEFFCKKLIPRAILSDDGRQNGEAKSYLAMDLLIAEQSWFFLNHDLIVIDNTKIILVNVYAPNETNQQVVFLKELSKDLLSKYDNELIA